MLLCQEDGIWGRRGAGKETWVTELPEKWLLSLLKGPGMESKTARPVKKGVPSDTGGLSAPMSYREERRASGGGMGYIMYISGPIGCRMPLGQDCAFLLT